MISFRYHVVTIVAVFVALAVGILMGTTFPERALVTDLQRRTENLSTKVNQLQQDVTDARAGAAVYQHWAETSRSLAVNGRLVGTRVVVVTEDGVNLSDLNG